MIRRLFGYAICCTFIGFTYSTPAVDLFWDGEGGDLNWSNPTNWGTFGSPGSNVAPTAADNPFIGTGAVVSITQPDAQALLLRVGHNTTTNFRNGNLVMNDPGAALTVDQVRLGNNGGGTVGVFGFGQGTLTLSNTANEAFYVGYDNNSTGIFAMGWIGSNDTLATMTYDGGRFEVCRAAGGFGEFTLNSGTITGSQNIVVGQGRGRASIFVNGGRFYTSADMNFNNGTITYGQARGVVSVDDYNMNNNAADTSTHNLSGGMLTVRNGFNDRAGYSIFNLSGGGLLYLPGNNANRDVEEWSQTGSGTLRLALRSYDTGVPAPLSILSTGVFAGTPMVEIESTNLPARTAFNKTVIWTGGAGVWDLDGSKWDAGHIPASGPDIVNGTAFDIITSVNPMNNPATLSTPTAGWTVAPLNLFTVQVTRTGGDIGSNDIAIAEISQPGSILGRVGDLRIVPEVGVGDASRLNQSDGRLLIGGNLILGGTNNGIVNHDGGSITISNNLWFGFDTNSPFGGTYNLNAGATLTVHGNILEQAPSVNGAQMQLNGGQFNVAGTILVQRFSVGEAGGSAAAITVTNSITTSGTLAVGGSGNGTMIIDSNSPPVDATNMDIGAAGAGQGLVRIDGGTLNVNGSFDLGQAGTAQGTLQIDSGNLNVTGGWDIGGDATTDTGNRGDVMIGTLVGGAPQIRVSGNTEVGHGGIGNLTMVDGIFRQYGNNIVIAQGADATGRLVLAGGSISITNSLNMNQGDGQLDLDGGSLSVRDLRVGALVGNSAQRAQVNHPGTAILEVRRHLRVGEDSRGEFNQSGGDISLSNGHLYVGGDGSATPRTNAVGLYNMTPALAGSLNVYGGNFEVGRNPGAVGTFNHLNGTVRLGQAAKGSNLVIGQYTNSIGTYNMMGAGVLPSLILNRPTNNANGNMNFNSGHGTFNLDVGSVTFNGGNLNLGNNNLGSSTFNLNGGLLTMNGGVIDFRNNSSQDVFNAAGGMLDMKGGTIHVDNRTALNPNEFNFTAGTVRDVGQYNGTLHQQGGFLEIGTNDTTMNVSGSYSNHSAGTIRIDISWDGAGIPAAGTDFDQLVLGGRADLNADGGAGSSLEINVTDLGITNAAPGTRLTIIDGTAPVAGMFVQGTVVSNNGMSFAIDYAGGADSNDVDLVVVASIDPEGDTDGDGITDLFEVSAGTDPFNGLSGAEGLPYMGRNTNNNANLFFRRLTAPGPITYGIESSTNLTSWLLEGVVPTVSTNQIGIPPGVERVQALFLLTPDDRKYFRVRVETP